MIKHIVMYRLKDRSEENKKALCDKFSSMKGKIDTLVDVTAGADFLGSERSFDVVLITTFKNRADMEAYQSHPYHVDVVKSYVKSVTESSHSVDYIIPELFARIDLFDGRSMRAKLFKDKAPISVDNFVKLAKDGFYNGLIFHRVIRNFMIQGGGMNENLEQKGGAKPIKGEFSSNGVNNDEKHTVGTLSMARTMVKDSATSQFFICVADTPHLDGEYAAFGRCVDSDSIAVAKSISEVPTTSKGYYQDVPKTPIVIKNIEIFEE